MGFYTFAVFEGYFFAVFEDLDALGYLLDGDFDWEELAGVVVYDFSSSACVCSKGRDSEALGFYNCHWEAFVATEMQEDVEWRRFVGSDDFLEMDRSS